MRPAAWGAGATSAALAGAAIWQGLASRDAVRRADGMILPGGSLRAGATAADFDRARADASRSRDLAWAAAGGSAAFAAAAGLLGWLAWNEAGQPVVRF
jgi:hypothetical protein